MKLLEFRKLLVNTSGRFDLVKDTEEYLDDGANFFIGAGQRMLDSMFTHSKVLGIAEVKTEPQKSVYSFPNLLSLSVLQASSDSGRITLTQTENLEAHEQTGGSPRCYSLFSGVVAKDGQNIPSTFKGVSVVIHPVPESSLTLYAYGRVSMSLDNDDDFNFWTVNYPETLMAATLYQIERYQRNTQGMRDYLISIQEDLRNIDANQIESIMGSSTQMNDSFKFRGKGNVE